MRGAGDLAQPLPAAGPVPASEAATVGGETRATSLSFVALGARGELVRLEGRRQAEAL